VGNENLPVHFERVLRALPLWLLREYLEELGGRSLEDGTIVGPGWIARLVQAEDYRVGSINVGQVRLFLEAEIEVWQRLQPALEKKLMRAGG